MKAIPSIFLLLCLTGLLSCDSLVQEVDPDNVPTATAKLVIHSYLSPQDTVLAVLVETPEAVIGQQNAAYTSRRTVANATVSLSDGVTSVQLPFSVADRLYRLPAIRLPIAAARTYTLTVTAPGFPTATAQCIVPAPVRPTEVRVDSSFINRFGEPRTTYVAQLYWQDQAGQPNFYRVAGQATQTARNGNPVRNYTYTNQLYFDGTLLTSDQSRDGESFTSPRGELLTYYGSPLDRPIALSFTMTLSNTDETFYRYHDALTRQNRADENPFAEPSLIPSNIQNGLGCFAAYNQASLTVKVR